jgi:hypothetical protein
VGAAWRDVAAGGRSFGRRMGVADKEEEPSSLPMDSPMMMMMMGKKKTTFPGFPSSTLR